MKKNAQPTHTSWCVTFAAVMFAFTSFAQYNPITITGFNHDVIAEGTNSSLSTTTIPMDGVTVSNKVMYSENFRSVNGISGGGIPDNGVFTGAFGNFQFASYAGNNALLLQRNQNGDLNIAVPAKFYQLRMAALSTEGPSQLNVTLHFTDGSSTQALTAYVLADWFNGNTNVVAQGIGRVSRLANVVPADAGSFPSNPRIYYFDIPVSCADSKKDLQRINIANATTTGTNAPYPNTIVFALSGTAGLSVSSTVTDANCNNEGTIALQLNGPATPYTVTWNSNPVETGVNVSLPAGSYTATITDANNCSTTANATINLVNDLTLDVRDDTTVCIGQSFTAQTQSNATAFNWTPSAGVSDPNSASPVITPPLGTTSYTVTATSLFCSSTGTFNVTVPDVTANAGQDVDIIEGQSTQLNATASTGTYVWTPSDDLSDAGILNPVANPTDTVTYTLTVTDANGCTASDAVTVNVEALPDCTEPMEAISPNGDGINDRWFVGTERCFVNASVKIFNRYGSPVYENKNYRNDWQGTYKGKPVPDGTYYFVIEFTYRTGRKAVRKGNVTIIR